MANSNRRNDAPSRTPTDNPQKRRADGQDSQPPQEPPIRQVNPNHKGLNPDHLGPAQPRKPGK